MYISRDRGLCSRLGGEWSEEGIKNLGENGNNRCIKKILRDLKSNKLVGL